MTDGWKDRYAILLREFIDGYRVSHPNDARNDAELCECLMEHLVMKGIAEKIDGRYVLPRVRDDA